MTDDPLTALRAEILGIASSLHARGLAGGSSGNISCRVPGGGMLITPTGRSLGMLEESSLSLVSDAGEHVAGEPPSKEWPLHRAMYAARATARAVIHLHATHSAAVSCMGGLDHADCLPPLTAYFVMKVGHLPLAPYFRPGDASLAPAIVDLAREHPAILLSNHGPLVSGTSLPDALYRIEELEETARLFLLLKGHPVRPLDQSMIAEIERTFGPACGSESH